MDYFSQHIFSDPKKKPLDYSLWFLHNFDEMMASPKLCKKHISQKPSVKEQNGTCFSVVALSSEE